MTFINKFNQNLRALEIATRVRTIYEHFSARKTAIDDERLSSAMEEAKQKADEVIRLSDSSREVSELDELDSARDKAVQNLFLAAEFHENCPIAASNEGIKPIRAILDNHGKSLVTLRYSLESGKINSLLKDLSSPELEKAISSLFGVKECIEDLKEKQAAFEAADVKYSASVASNKGKKNSTVMKKELIAFANENVVAYVNFMQKMDSAKYEDFAKEVEEEVREANLSVTRQEKSKKAN